MPQLLFLTSKELCDTLAASHDADRDACIRMPVHVVKEHGGTINICGAPNSAAGADIAVDTAELRFGIDGNVGLDQLAGGVSKKLQGGAKINDFVHCVPPYNWVHVFTVLLRFNVLRAVQLVRTSIPRAPSSVIICSSIF